MSRMNNLTRGVIYIKNTRLHVNISAD